MFDLRCNLINTMFHVMFKQPERLESIEYPTEDDRKENRLLKEEINCNALCNAG